MGKTRGFISAAKDIDNRRGSARALRRKAEKLAKQHAGKSIPALKKIIRREPV